MDSTKSEKIMVGLSGGVDSSVTAALLVNAGYQVEGLFMFNWEEEDTQYCTSSEDYADAKRVCDTLGIPLHQTNFAHEYRELVFAHFLSEYQAGRTPNPDVLCNREIKFGAFLAHSKRLGADKIATGHYARIVPAGEQVELHMASDSKKDQSYFLHAVPQAALAQSLFPLGELEKTEVRTTALEQGLHVHKKHDSTGICFVGERPFREFLKQFIPAQPGEIRTLDDMRVGEHVGLMFYTLGQRQGLGIGGQANAKESPWYVAKKDLGANVLYVTQEREHECLMSSSMAVDHLTWISGSPPALPVNCQVKTRYRQTSVNCEINYQSNKRLSVHFETPQWAVTPGQYAVFYEGTKCLGGGTIDSHN
ncbi:MAG: tRNA 2-thiouridine(34) synthase MnmA [Gammaproteobacteria bacterium]|nr:tRNA 2-thiouridine(34) synthase MnmA [Gammaproteobacteria bacterium]